MELSKLEVAAVEATTLQAQQTMLELSELELAMVGGGVGEVILG